MHDDSEIEQIAARVAERVNQQLFIALGINVRDPEELIEIQRDFAHLRGWRENMEVIRHKGLGAAVAFCVTALLGYIVFLLTKH